MSVVICLRNDQRVLFAADSAAVAMETREIQVRNCAKVFKRGQYLIGYCGSYRMGQLLRYEIELPEPPRLDAVDLQKFLVRDFIGAVREGFQAGGFYRKREDGQDLGGLFVISVHGRIFEVLKDFQIIEPVPTYTAIGWGAITAIGALTALESFDNIDLRRRAEIALETSERLCWAVRRPFTFVDSAVPG